MFPALQRLQLVEGGVALACLCLSLDESWSTVLGPLCDIKAPTFRIYCHLWNI